MHYLSKTKIFLFINTGFNVVHLFHTALIGPLLSCALHWALPQSKYQCTETSGQ